MDLTATYCDPDGNVVETTGAPCQQPPCDEATLEWVQEVRRDAASDLNRPFGADWAAYRNTDERDRRIVRLCDLLLGAC